MMPNNDRGSVPAPKTPSPPTGMQDPLFSKRVALALNAEWWYHDLPQDVPDSEYIKWSDAMRERKAAFRAAIQAARRFEDLPPQHQQTLLAIEASEGG